MTMPVKKKRFSTFLTAWVVYFYKSGDFFSFCGLLKNILLLATGFVPTDDVDKN